MRQLDTGHFSVEGRADFILKASGTPGAPSIDADVHVRNLTLDHELEGELDLQAITRGSDLHLTGNSRLQHGAVLLSGNVRMRDGYPSTLSVQMDQLDLDMLASRYLRGQHTEHSVVTGSLELRGPLREPRRWILDGTLTDLAVEVDKVKVHNQDPIRFSLANQSLSLQQFHLVGREAI